MRNSHEVYFVEMEPKAEWTDNGEEEKGERARRKERREKEEGDGGGGGGSIFLSSLHTLFMFSTVH